MMQTMDLWLAPHDFRVRSINRISHGFASTPFGDCVAIATPTHLLALHFTENHRQTLIGLQSVWSRAKFHPSPAVAKLIQLALTHPEKIPVLAIGTPFQLTVWEFLRSIPRGSTMTYGAVAKTIGRPSAARAVGQAVGKKQSLNRDSMSPDRLPRQTHRLPMGTGTQEATPSERAHQPEFIDMIFPVSQAGTMTVLEAGASVKTL